jgi:hypothetical protein
MPRILKGCQRGPARGNNLVLSVTTGFFTTDFFTTDFFTTDFWWICSDFDSSAPAETQICIDIRNPCGLLSIAIKQSVVYLYMVLGHERPHPTPASGSPLPIHRCAPTARTGRRRTRLALRRWTFPGTAQHGAISRRKTWNFRSGLPLSPLRSPHAMRARTACCSWHATFGLLAR